MNLRSLVLRVAGGLLLAAVTLVPAFAQPGPAAAKAPAALQALEKRGLKVVGILPAPAGMSAYAGYMGQQPLALYVTPDGQQIIAGTLIGADGSDRTHAALAKAVAKPMAEAVWHQLGASRWLADGRSGAPVVYVFTDPNCPYCNRLWSEARPWVTAGKVQLRHVIVGILTPTSAGKAAALLAAKDPAAALAAYEGRNVAATTRAMASGHPRPLDDGVLEPLSAIPPATQAALDGNAHLMESLGLQATPAIVWRNAQGALQVSEGVPQGGLASVLGPR